MNEEDVDVIIPYSKDHTERYKLERAKESAINQEVDVNIIVSEDDFGPAYGRNRGLERSENRFVAFLDADDEWKPRKLKKQIDKLNGTKSGICVTNVDTGSEVIRPKRSSETDFIRDLLVGEIYSLTSSIVIDTSQVKQKFNEDIYRFEDHMFILEVLESSNICFVDEILTIVNKHDKGLTANENKEKKINANKKIIEKSKSMYPSLEDELNSYMANKLRHIGRDFYFEGDYDSALEYYIDSASYKPKLKTFGALFLLLLKKPKKISHIPYFLKSSIFL